MSWQANRTRPRSSPSRPSDFTKTNLLFLPPHPERIRFKRLFEFLNLIQIGNRCPPHGCGALGDVMSAHFAASVPNLRIVEYDADDVPWKAEFLTKPPVVENGEMLVPQDPGWGTNINEAAVRAHPPR